MAYREFRPAQRLTGFVTCTWERDAPEPRAPQVAAVLPDGCVDLVWRAGELLVAGPDSRPFLSPLPSTGDIAGLRLRPGTAGAVLGLPASELRDSRVPLEEIWGPSGAALADRLGQAASARHRRLRSRTRLPPPAGRRRARPAGARGRGEPGSPGKPRGRAERVARHERAPAAAALPPCGRVRPEHLDRVLRFQRFLARARDGDLARTAADSAMPTRRT